MKLNQLTREFYFHCEVERCLSAHTVDAYRHDLDQYLRFMKVDVSVEKALEPDSLKAFLTDMRVRRGLSASTIRRRLACLKAMSRYAEEHHSMTNPFKDWRPKIKRPKRLPRALQQSDVIQLLGSPSRMGDDDTAFATMVLGATGLRVSELCAITAADVTEDGGSIRVTGKGTKDRIVYLTNPRLMARMSSRRLMRLTDGASAPIFVNSRGGQMSPQTLRRRLHKYAEAVGLEKRVTPHILRHTAATMLLEQGTDIRFVQRLLGHASIATTEIYTHVTDEALRAAVRDADTMGLVLRSRS
ncbi:MAG: tyrosine-type recombinase/integrase [Pseudomonadota bacterium]